MVIVWGGKLRFWDTETARYSCKWYGDTHGRVRQKRASEPGNSLALFINISENCRFGMHNRTVGAATGRISGN